MVLSFISNPRSRNRELSRIRSNLDAAVGDIYTLVYALSQAHRQTANIIRDAMEPRRSGQRRVMPDFENARTSLRTAMQTLMMASGGIIDVGLSIM